MGTLSFGLVSVPVKLYSAVTRRTVHFNQIHSLDNGRIHQKHVCSLDGEEIPLEEIVKGYEIAPDRYIPVEARELQALEPLFTRTIQVEDFVEIGEIDPIYFDRPYHLVPGIAGAHAYQAAVEGHARHRQGRDRAHRHALQRKACRDPPSRRSPADAHDELRRRAQPHDWPA